MPLCTWMISMLVEHMPEESYRVERQRQKQQLVEITQLCNSPLSTSSK